MRELYRESLRESDDESILANEIAGLELQLAKAKQRLNAKRRAATTTTTTATTATTTATTTTASVSETAASSEATDSSARPTPLTSARTTPVVAPSPATATATTTMMADSSHHYLLLLSDSALPLGSFAFSSGLESYLAHARPSTSSSSSSTLLYKPSFASFLPLSLSSYASTALPFALAAHRAPSALARLDDALDASIVCAVGRRASTAQGRALLSIWEKSLAPSSSSSSSSSSTDMEARGALESYSAALRHASRTTTTTTTTNGSGSGSGSSSSGRDVDVEALPPLVSAHLAPLFGAVARLLGLTAHQAAYVFLLGHAKALVSAAVRAGMFGPYQAQKVLAGAGLRALVADLVAREWDVPVARAAQSVPVMDLWVGRHEMLYSRIFNS